MKSYSDDQLRAHIIELTAGLRYANIWQDHRTLVAKHGVDPQQSLVLDCDQGGSVLMCPDGELVVFDVYGNGYDWELVEFVDVEYLWREISIGLEILASSNVSEFNAEVQRFHLHRQN